jgi:16S rRNA pseudouridine516 synthase
MFEALGKRVIYLKRISMGPLKLPADLKTGTYRALTQAETDMLMQIKSGK